MGGPGSVMALISEALQNAYRLGYGCAVLDADVGAIKLPLV